MIAFPLSHIDRAPQTGHPEGGGEGSETPEVIGEIPEVTLPEVKGTDPEVKGFDEEVNGGTDPDVNGAGADPVVKRAEVIGGIPEVTRPEVNGTDPEVIRPEVIGATDPVDAIGMAELVGEDALKLELPGSVMNVRTSSNVSDEPVYVAQKPQLESLPRGGMITFAGLTSKV